MEFPFLTLCRLAAVCSISLEEAVFTSHHLLTDIEVWLVQIDDLEGAKRAGDLFGYPLMLKSKRLAYDGRGNAVAKSEEELASAVNG